MDDLGINKHNFEKLFRDNYEKLYYHSLSFLNDEEASKDIVNDVFEHIWSKRSEFDFSYSIKPLLYKMVQSNCIDYIRHKKVKKRYHDYMVVRNELFEEDYEDYDKLIERLRMAIENLPDQSRIVFKKCYIEGKRYKEVGKELGISINTVKTHVSKSLRRLRRDFQNDILLYFFSFRKK